MGPDCQFETSYRADRVSMAAIPKHHWPQLHAHPCHTLLSGLAVLDPHHGLWVNCGLRIDRTLGLLSLV